MTEQTTTTWFDGESLGAGPGFNAWILAGPEGPVPVGAGSDLVVGSIRWLKLLDAPAGQLTDAFKIRCFHCQPAGDKLNPEPLKGLFVKHSIRIWEGPHDDRYFRVSFSSFSAPNQDDWSDEDLANGRDRNVVQLFFGSGVVWKNNVFSGKGSKGFIPQEVKFSFPGRPILLQSEVLHFPSSARYPIAEPLSGSDKPCG